MFAQNTTTIGYRNNGGEDVRDTHGVCEDADRDPGQARQELVGPAVSPLFDGTPQ